MSSQTTSTSFHWTILLPLLHALRLCLHCRFEMGMLFVPSLWAASLTHRHASYSCSSVVGIITQNIGHAAPAQSAAGTAQVSFCSWQAPAGDRHAVRFPLPYTLPPAEYISGLDKPWTRDGHHSGPDALGMLMGP